MTLLAALLALVPASGVTPRAHALQLDDFTKLQRRILSGLAYTTLSERAAGGSPATVANDQEMFTDEVAVPIP